jgi:hypothetical protein
MTTINLNKLNKSIQKLKTSTYSKSSIESYYLKKPNSSEQKKYYSLVFENNKTHEWIILKKNTNIFIKYFIEFITTKSVDISIFLGIKNNDKINIIKTSKINKVISPKDNKISDVVLYKTLYDEELCIIVKIPFDVNITDNSIFTIYESNY